MSDENSAVSPPRYSGPLPALNNVWRVSWVSEDALIHVKYLPAFFTPQQALSLAAWLVYFADPGLESFDRILSDVFNKDTVSL